MKKVIQIFDRHFFPHFRFNGTLLPPFQMICVANKGDWGTEWPTGNCILKRVNKTIYCGDARRASIARGGRKSGEGGLPVPGEANIAFNQVRPVATPFNVRV
jgi:hypothetical protein